MDGSDAPASTTAALGAPEPDDPLANDALKAAIVSETFRVTGLGRYPVVRTVARVLLQVPVSRFAGLAADFESAVAESGLKQASEAILTNFVSRVEVRGVESIPVKGPLLLAANHPAAYDLFLIAASLPRDDLKVISSTVSIIDRLPASRERFIFVSSDAHVRMAAVRHSIRHLQQGGSLLVFPTGLVDPDPDVSSGAHEALDRWSPSLALFMRRAPQTKVVPVIVSGVLSPAWARSPITHLRSDPHNRQKIAEIFQVIQQLFFPNSLRMSPRLSFGAPASLAELLDGNSSDLTASTMTREIIARAHCLLDAHMEGRSPALR